MQCCSFSSIVFFVFDLSFLCLFVSVMFGVSCEQGLNPASPPKPENCVDEEERG